jgi:MinD-like ATPase involved in chromosome partitioning or flagellar assembly
MAEYGDTGQPIVLAAPNSESAQAFKAITGDVARKLVVLTTQQPAIADASITWVTS